MDSKPGAMAGTTAEPTPAVDRGDAPRADREPRTERGRRTLRKLLDAAAAEFGERGFHDASISAITRRAGIALDAFRSAAARHPPGL